MRRILVLAALLGLMLGLKALQAGTGVGTADPLTLASIGFVVLAAFTVGEIATLAKLPRITGYILSGVALGPQVSDVLSSRIVTEMSVFNTLALGLIATTAGLELDIGAIRRVARTLGATIGLKIPLLLVLVGIPFYVLESTFGFLGVESNVAIASLAVIIAVIGIGTSPSISLAVINETKAKGRLTDITLAIAVAKDLVVVLALAVTIAIVRSMITPDAKLDASVFLHVGQELGGSLLFGALLGGAFILYLRYVNKEMLLAVVVSILLAAEVTRALHLELLLVFIAAGFVVRNFSKYEHALLSPLVKISLPVFVVFFTTAGAGVDLIGTAKILPLAIALTAGRVIALFIAGRYGARWGKESVPIQTSAWLAYVPQAGVTLGLVLLAAEALPSLSAEILRTGLALVAINLVAGPVLLGIALRRVGEVPGTAPVEKKEKKAPQSKPESNDADEPAPPSARPPAPTTKDLDPELGREIEALAEALRVRAKAIVEEEVEPTAERARKLCLRLLMDASKEDANPAEAIARALQDPQERPTEDWDERLARAFSELQRLVVDLEGERVVPMSKALLVLSSREGPHVWIEKLARRAVAAVGLKQRRKVPLRLAARYALEARLAEALAVLGADVHRMQLRTMAPMRRVATNALDAKAARTEVVSLSERFEEEAQRDLHSAIDEGLVELIELVSRLGAPGASTASLRLSERSPRITAAKRRIESSTSDWHRVVDAALDKLRAVAAVELMVKGFGEILDRRLWSALSLVDNELLDAGRVVRERTDALLQQIEKPADPFDRKVIFEGVEALYPRRERNRLQGLRTKFRHSTHASDLLGDLSAMVERAPKRVAFLVGNSEEVREASRAEIQELRLSRDGETVVIDGFVPPLLDAVGRVSEMVVLGKARVEEAVDAGRYGVTTAGTEHPEDDAAFRQAARDALVRSRERQDTYAAELTEVLTEARQEIHAASVHALESLRALVAEDKLTRDRARAPSRDTRRRIARALEAARNAVSSGRSRVARVVLGIWRRRQVRDWLIRSGQRRLDATDMRNYVSKFLPEPAKLTLAPVYRNLFALEPIEDLRLAVAYRSAIDDLVRSVQPGRHENFANVMITGEHGSGRTSVMNILELRLARHRVIRVDSRFHRRTDGLLVAMSAELGCSAAPAALVNALRGRTTVILIDDLEQYVLPTPEGIAELQRFLQVVVETSAFTHWVVAAQSGVLALLNELTSLGAAFGRRFLLAPLGWKEVQRVIEARISLSGFEVSMEERRFLGRAWPGGGRRTLEDYYKTVARVSGGNLRAALLAHLRSCSTLEETKISAKPPELSRVPFGDQIPTDALATLGLVLRFGPMTQGELAKALSLPSSEVLVHLLPLEDAGIVRRSLRRRRINVPPHLEHAITSALARQKILKETS